MTKKIFFYAKMNFGNPHSAGIKKKVVGQKKALNHLGFDTDLMYIESDQIILDDYRNGIKRITIPSKWKFLKYLYHDFITQFELAKYDVFYLRHFPMHPLSWWMLFQLKRRHPAIKIIVEFPTFPYSKQLKAISSWHYFSGVIDDVFTPLAMKYADRVLTVSQHTAIFGKATLITSNGIDVSQFKPIALPIFEDSLNIVGLANVQIWHGYDRVIKGLEQYYQSANRPLKVRFHIIGAGKECDNIAQLANDCKVAEYVVLHGALFGDALYDTLQQCHVGLGALADFRVGMDNAAVSPLKNREYCAFGLPFVCTYKDSDLPADFPFVLLMNADEQPISIAAIVDFYTTLRQHYPDYTTQMHQFTKTHLSWESKFLVLKNYLS
jgi:hypothetical protein